MSFVDVHWSVASKYHVIHNATLLLGDLTHWAIHSFTQQICHFLPDILATTNALCIVMMVQQ